MNGIVFVELLYMAADAFGDDVVDSIVEAADLPSRGILTSIGSDQCEDLMILVQRISQLSGVPGAEMQRLFDHWMMDSFKTQYLQFMENRSGSLAILAATEDDIYTAVRKLYPDADLLSFETHEPAPDTLDTTYRLPRPLADFCEGLIEASVETFGEIARMTRTDQLDGEMSVSDFMTPRAE